MSLIRFHNTKNNWKETKLGNVAAINMGQSPEGKTYNKNGVGLPLINGPTEFTNTHPVKIQWTTKPTKMCEIGDLLLCVRGSSTGRINISNDKYCIGRGIAAISNKNGTDKTYLIYLINLIVDYITSLTTGSTFPNLDSKTLRNVQISLPGIAEQRNIASVLKTLDLYLENLNKKIELKKKIKKELTQKIISGTLRLSGFTDSWKVVHLNNICKIFDGTHQTPDYVENGVPFYSVEHVTANEFTKTKYISEEVYEVEIKRTMMKKNDILMTRIGSIGAVKYIDWNPRASFYVTLALLKVSKEVNPKFLSFALQSIDFQKELWKRTLHVAFPIKINLGDIGKSKVCLPLNIEEQTAIANILTAADQEIDSLEKKRDLIAAQKKFLLNKLITGEIRLPEFRENNE
jgi:type I restriction enzyme S subunit